MGVKLRLSAPELARGHLVVLEQQLDDREGNRISKHAARGSLVQPQDLSIRFSSMGDAVNKNSLHVIVDRVENAIIADA